MDKVKQIAQVGALLGVLLASGVFVSNTVTEKENPPSPQVGALSSPDIQSPYLSYGGVRRWAGRTDTMNTASTTVCSLQSPAATSSLVLSSGIRLTVSSTTASNVVAYKAAVPSTATTLLFGGAVAANAQGTIVATTTTDNFVFGPNQYLNIIMSGGTGTFSPTGVCQATFEQI